MANPTRMTPDDAGRQIAAALTAGQTIYYNGREGRSRHAPEAYVPDGRGGVTKYTLTRGGGRSRDAQLTVAGVAGNGLRYAWMRGDAWAKSE